MSENLTEKSDITQSLSFGEVYDEDDDALADCPVVKNIGVRIYELDNGEPLVAFVLQTGEGKTVVMDMQRDAFHDVLQLMLKCSEVFEETTDA